MKRLLTEQSVLAQGVRYVAMGGVVYVLDMGIFVFLTYLSPSAYLLANVVAKVSGAAAGFMLHKNVSFSWRQRTRTQHQLLIYVALSIGSMALATSLLYVGAALLGFAEVVAKFIADVIVITAGFVLVRRLVFQSVH